MTSPPRLSSPVYYIGTYICITYKPHQYQHCCFSYIQRRSGAHLLYTDDKNNNNNNDNICNACMKTSSWVEICYNILSNFSRLAHLRWTSYRPCELTVIHIRMWKDAEREKRENEILLQIIRGYGECWYRG